MAFTYGFYDSVNHDRLYNSVQFGELFEGILNDGVYKGYWNEFHVDPSGELKVTVDTGRAWFDNTWSRNTTKYSLDLDQSDSRLDRYDAVVLEVNHTKNTRKNELKVVKGELGVNPAKPVIIVDSNTKQFPLAYIYRHAGINRIYDADITQAVGSSECPYASLTASFSGGGGATSVNTIPNDWITGLFDPNYVLNPSNNSYYLNIVGLRTLVKEIKELDFGDGSGGGSGCGAGTSVCLGGDHTFAINTIPNGWLEAIMDLNLPEEHENCMHFLDAYGLLEYTRLLKENGVGNGENDSSKGDSYSGVVLYHNSSSTNSQIILSDSISNYKYVEVYVTFDYRGYSTSEKSVSEISDSFKCIKMSVSTGNNIYAQKAYTTLENIDAVMFSASEDEYLMRSYLSSCSIVGSVLSFGPINAYTFKAKEGSFSASSGIYTFTDVNNAFCISKVIGFK